MELDPIYYNATRKLEAIKKGNPLESFQEVVVTKSYTPTVKVVHSVFVGKTLGKKGRCFYCNYFADTLDHFYPKSKGGKLKVHCCNSCNNQKKDLTPEQWIMYIDHELNATDTKKEKMKKAVKSLIGITKF